MNRLLYTLKCLLLLSALGGCNKLGTGVLMWAPEDSRWESGDLFTVIDESFLNKSYIVNLPDQPRLKEEIDQWRLRIFKQEKDAAAWAASIGEWKDVYAECLYQGLPMRSEPRNTSDQVYRFIEGDLIKILSQEPGPVMVGNLEGFWYKVLAYGGVEGYVFDYHLKVIRIKGGEEEILNVRDTEDAQLNDFLSKTWRPKYFQNMINNKQINLDLFRPEYGFFINSEKQTLRVKLPETTLLEVWTDIIPVGFNRYDFHGTSFRVTVNTNTFVSIQYTADGTEHYEAFIHLGGNIDDYISAEIERQNQLYSALIENGPVYESRSYGSLALFEDGRCSWSGKSTLISKRILSLDAGNTASVFFDHFLAPEIAEGYDGVFRLGFDNGETLVFIYTLRDNGLNLLYIPDNSINDRIVITDQFFDSVRIFFKSTTDETTEDGVNLHPSE